MAKFQLGEYVEYTNARWGSPARGEIIGIDKLYCHYLISNPYKTNVGRTRKMDIRVAQKTRYEFLPHAFRENTFSSTLLTTKEPVFVVTFGSRNIKTLELKYNPEQQPDEEDDI